MATAQPLADVAEGAVEGDDHVVEEDLENSSTPCMVRSGRISRMRDRADLEDTADASTTISGAPNRLTERLTRG